MTAWLTFPERRPGLSIALVGLLLALTYSAALRWLPRSDGRIIAGDAVHYYVYLRSLVFDRDLQFLDDYTSIATGIPDEGHDGPEWLDERTSTGHIRNMMSIGPALAWMPLFLLTCAFVAVGRTLGAAWPLDGLWWPFQASTSYSGILAATLAAWFMYRAGGRVASSRAAIWATLTMWLGTHALYYSLVSPQYSHAVSMFAASVFLWRWLDTVGRTDLRRFAELGALGGLAALMRWQDAVLLAAPAVELAWRLGERDRRWTFLAGRLAVCGGTAILCFAPQLLAWQVLFGRPLLVPQGGQFMHWTDPALVAVLLSTWHGLFTWSPIVVLGLVGVGLYARRTPACGVALLAVFLLTWYANAAVADWWAGEAFGARRFMSVVPIFALGLAVVADRVTSLRRLAAAATVLVVLNLLLLVQYQTFMKGRRDLAPYPKGAYNLFVARFVVPFDLVRAWWAR